MNISWLEDKEDTTNNLCGQRSTEIIQLLDTAFVEANFNSDLQKIRMAKSELSNYSNTGGILNIEFKSWQELRMTIAKTYNGATIHREDIVSIFWQNTWKCDAITFENYKLNYIDLVYEIYSKNILQFDDFFSNALSWFIYHLPCGILKNEISRKLPLDVVRCITFEKFLEGVTIIEKCIKNSNSWIIKQISWTQEAWDNNFVLRKTMQDIL